MKLMKAKLIKVDDVYRLVEVTKHGNSIIGTTDLDYQKAWSDRCQKLSLKNCQAIIERGYDLDELAEETYPICNLGLNSTTSLHTLHQKSFKEGFQKAVEILGDKKFSEEDVRKTIQSTISGCSVKRVTNRYIPDELLDEVECSLSEEDIIQELQQTEWDVKVEMEYVGECNGNNNEGCFQDSPGHDCGCFKRKMKLDENGYLILKKI